MNNTWQQEFHKRFNGRPTGITLDEVYHFVGQVVAAIPPRVVITPPANPPGPPPLPAVSAAEVDALRLDIRKLTDLVEKSVTENERLINAITALYKVEYEKTHKKSKAMAKD